MGSVVVRCGRFVHHADTSSERKIIEFEMELPEDGGKDADGGTNFRKMRVAFRAKKRSIQ